MGQNHIFQVEFLQKIGNKNKNTLIHTYSPCIWVPPLSTHQCNEEDPVFSFWKHLLAWKIHASSIEETFYLLKVLLPHGKVSWKFCCHVIIIDKAIDKTKTWSHARERHEKREQKVNKAGKKELTMLEANLHNRVTLSLTIRISHLFSLSDDYRLLSSNHTWC